MAKAKAPSTAVVPWDEEVAKLAEQMGDARKSGGGGNFIGVSAAGFSVGGEDIGTEMNVVIIDYVTENQYYEGAFDSENPEPPVCFAFARKESDLKPHESSPDPQHETCEGCPQNAWGSAGGGRKGKACKNVMRIAMITEGDLDNVPEAEVHMMKVSVTNVAHFSAYLEKLKNPNLKLGKNPKPFQVVTTIKVAPNKKTQIQLSFELVEDIPEEARGAMLKKVAAQLDKTMVGYAPKEAEEAAPVNDKAKKFTKKR